MLDYLLPETNGIPVPEDDPHVGNGNHPEVDPLQESINIHKTSLQYIDTALAEVLKLHVTTQGRLLPRIAAKYAQARDIANAVKTLQVCGENCTKHDVHECARQIIDAQLEYGDKEGAMKTIGAMSHTTEDLTAAKAILTKFVSSNPKSKKITRGSITDGKILERLWQEALQMPLLPEWARPEAIVEVVEKVNFHAILDGLKQDPRALEQVLRTLQGDYATRLRSALTDSGVK